ncbi:MAG: hypothetical protein ABSG17_06295 [Spirochaetia bacterium]|jgi:hypothetical protein
MQNCSSEYKQQITDSLPEIIVYFRRRLHSSAFYQFYSSKDDAEFHHDELLEKYLNRHLEVFRPLDDTDENYDVVCAFKDSFKRNIEKYVYYDLKRTLSKRREVSLQSLDEGAIERLSTSQYQEDDMSDKVHKQIVQERLENLNKEFNKYINTLEKKMIYAMSQEYSWQQLIEHVGFTQSAKLLTLEEARHIRNVLEYRLVCWYAVNKFLDPELILKGLNRHPNLNKRFFEVEKVVAIPDMAIMKRVAKGNTKRPEKHQREGPKHTFEEIKRQVGLTFKDVRENPGSRSKWVFCTPWYNGKHYDSPKVFINKSGFAYSHIDKKVWDIFPPEAVA